MKLQTYMYGMGKHSPPSVQAFHGTPIQSFCEGGGGALVWGESACTVE